MRSITQQTMYFVDGKTFDSFDKAKYYALKSDLIEVIGVKLHAHATTHQIVDFLFENASDIRDILINYCAEFGPEGPACEVETDPVSPSPTEG